MDEEKKKECRRDVGPSLSEAEVTLVRNMGSSSGSVNNVKFP